MKKSEGKPNGQSKKVSERDNRILAIVPDIMRRYNLKNERQFLLDVGFNEALLSRVRTKYQSFSDEFIEAILRKYSISPMYVYQGIGDAFSKSRLVPSDLSDSKGMLEIDSSELEEVDLDRVSHIRIPVVDLEVAASVLTNVETGYRISEVITEREKIERQPNIKYTHLTVIFRIKGDSMEPNYRQGEKILCTWVDPSNWAFLQGVCVVSLNTGMLLLKRVSGNGDGRLRLKSDNERYEDLQVTPDQIQAVWQLQYFTLAHKR